MNNLKLLSAAVLLVLAQSAFAILEIEPNNNSTLAKELKLGGEENIGQLSNGNDVDFYAIDASKDISLTFACNSRAIAQNNTQYGWYLTIHDDKGELQSSYQVVPEECVTGTTTAKGPYNFRIPKLNELNRKYYLSVVGDCRRPIFNVAENPLLSVNTFDKPATKSDMKKAQDAFDGMAAVAILAQDNLQKLVDQRWDDRRTVAFDIIPAQVNINVYGDETLKNIKLPEIVSTEVFPVSISMQPLENYIKSAGETLDEAVLNVASKAQLSAISSTSLTAKSMLAALPLLSNSQRITLAKDRVVEAAAKITSSNVQKADIDNLITAINQFNQDIKIDDLTLLIDDLNSTVEKLELTVATAQDICTTGNTANYTIKDNPDTGITPYKESNIKNNLTVLGKENSGQNGSVSDVDFFEIAGSQGSILPVKFSCAKSNAKGNSQGWVISAWQTNENDQGQWKLDKPAFVYQVSPADCNAPEVYTVDLKPYEKNYIIGVQSACALPPVNTETKLRPSSYLNYFDYAELDYLCDANTANFTLKRDLKTATPLVVDVPKTGEMSSRSIVDPIVQTIFRCI